MDAIYSKDAHADQTDMKTMRVDLRAMFVVSGSWIDRTNQEIGATGVRIEMILEKAEQQ